MGLGKDKLTYDFSISENTRAKGDDSTDDLAELQNLFNDIPIKGGAIDWRESKIYKITDVLKLPEDRPIDILCTPSLPNSTKGTILKWYGATNKRIIQCNDSVKGTSAIQENSHVSIKNLTIDINLSTYAESALAIENVKDGFFQHILVKNSAAPDPPATGGIGINVLPLGGSTIELDACRVVRADIGMRIAADWVTSRDFVASQCNTKGVSIENDPYLPILLKTHGFQCGGNLIHCSNTDTTTGRNPIIIGVLDENDRFSASYAAKSDSVFFSSGSGQKAIVIGVQHRGTVPAGINYVGGSGLRNMQLLTHFSRALGIDALGRQLYSHFNFIGQQRNTSGLPAATLDGTETFNNSTNGQFGNFATGAVSGNDAGLAFANLIRTDGRPILVIVFRLPSTTNERLFIGLSDQTLATMVGTDSPAGNYIGLQYSTPRADANWQFVSKDNANQNPQDTGLPVDTSVHKLLINCDGGNGAGISLHPPTTGTPQAEKGSMANRPTSTVQLGIICGIETETAGAKNLELYKGELWAR